MKNLTPMTGYVQLLPIVGEKKNYNLVNYTQYAIGTIEWVTNENRYRARVGFTGAEGFVFERVPSIVEG
jgi:hypothetical protein